MNYLATLLALFLASSSLTASLDPMDVIVVADPTTRSVVIRSATAVTEATTMMIYTQRGDHLYTAEIGAGAFVSKRFPLTAFPAAKYVLHFSDQHGRTTLPFTADNKQQIRYSFTDGTRTVFPFVDVQEARTLVLSYPATEQSTAYRMTLQTLGGKTIYIDEVDTAASVRKAIQLPGLSAGTYTVAFAADNRRLHSTAITLR